MDRKKRFAYRIFKIAVGLCLISAAYNGIEIFRERRNEVPETEVVRPVRTVSLTRSARSVRHYFGTVRGSRRVDLSFRVFGPLKELPVEKGERVKKGDLLAEIDPRDFKTKLQQARGVLAQAKARHNEAVTNFKRYEELYRQKVIAEAEFDAHRTMLDVTSSALRAARAGEAAALDALRDTKLKAPFDGIIVNKLVERYQDIRPQQPVLSLQNISTLEIVFSVPDRDVALIPSSVRTSRELLNYSGISVSVGFDVAPGINFDARIKEFSLQADPRTNTYPVTVTLPQPENVRILPGMAVTATVDFAGPRDSETFLLPRNALLCCDDGREYVWCYRDGVVRRVEVKETSRFGDDVEIVSDGLKDGDSVVTAGIHFLKEGQKVRLMNDNVL